MANNLIKRLTVPAIASISLTCWASVSKREKIGPATISKYLVVPGKITTDPDRSAHVSPRYDGLVTKVFVSAGDVVQEGAPLASIERNIGVATYILKSPISGVVLDRQINPGDPVGEDQAAFQISDLSHVWATLHVKESELPHFRKGKTTTIRSRSGEDEVQGEIFFVSPVVDPGTRTAHVAIAVANKEKRWLPGKIVDGYLFQEKRNVPVAIPLSALKTELGRDYTFREQGGRFLKAYLRIGIKDSYFAEVLRGVEKDTFVTASPPKDEGHSDHASHEDHGNNEHEKDKHGHSQKDHTEYGEKKDEGHSDRDHEYQGNGHSKEEHDH